MLPIVPSQYFPRTASNSEPKTSPSNAGEIDQEGHSGIVNEVLKFLKAIYNYLFADDDVGWVYGTMPVSPGGAD